MKPLDFTKALNLRLDSEIERADLRKALAEQTRDRIGDLAGQIRVLQRQLDQAQEDLRRLTS